MDSDNVNLDAPKEYVEPPIEESTGVYLYGPYAQGPDAYVLSHRQNPLGSPAPQVVEEPESKSKPEGPVCPQCGNAITKEMSFCPECGTTLREKKNP